MSVGFLATGGVALGWDAVGGFAAGAHAYGGQVYAAVSGMGGRVHAPHVMKGVAEMPTLLQWLVKITDQGSFLAAWIWLPMLLPSVLMPWWARRQLEFEAQGGPQRATAWYERPSRMLWILPASLLLFLALIWMIRQWSIAGETGVTAQILIASGIESVGLLLAALSLPLWLRLVPMNSFYGVRLPSTFVSDKRWYEVNAVFGKHLFAWSLTIIAAGIAGFYQLPRYQESYAWASVTLILMAVAASGVATLWWMRQHPVSGTAQKRSRLAWWTGQFVVAVVIALFIKSFIAAPYKMAGSAETGVTQGSHWMVMRLNTGFSPGDMIVFLHENDQYWIARVIAVEDKGMRLKRGGSPDEFFMPWDRISGKMLFSYLSPVALPKP
ncbi:MAG: hypothetical protein JWR15_3269 [Prosthecobacter sp.]|nr:hypothetical protein [Prosthecobacter sp.]